MPSMASAGFAGRDRREAAGWLYGIAANLLRQWHRTRRVEREGRRRVGMPLRTYAAYEETGEVDERLDVAALRSPLAIALAALPPEQREAVAMRVVEGRSYEDIAGRLQSNAPAIRGSPGSRPCARLRGARA